MAHHGGGEDDGDDEVLPDFGGSPLGGIGDVDVSGLDEETQRFVLETHLENIGLFDFLGFELAALATSYSDYSRLPNVNATRAGGVGKMSDGSAYITLFKSFVGIGVLSLPYAMQLGGYIGGPVGIVIVAALAHKGMQLLVETSETMPGRVASFGTMALKLCGRWAKVVVEASLVVTQFGFCVAYVIFISENVGDVVCVETQGTACPSRWKICTVALALLVPFTLMKSLNVLAVPTLMSNLVLLAGIVYIYYCSFVDIADDGREVTLVAVNWAGLPLFFGVAVFTFEGICLILPIRQAMANPSHLPRQLCAVVVLLSALFISFGVVAYAAYGRDVNSMVTFNLPQNKVSSFLRLFYCLGIFFTYPVQMYPVHHLNEAKYECLMGPDREVRRSVLRLCIIILSGVIGMVVPNFGLFLGLLGSVACTLLAFVLPALFHLKRVDRTSATRLGDARDIGLILFGVVGGTVSFICTVREIVLLSAAQADEIVE